MSKTQLILLLVYAVFIKRVWTESNTCGVAWPFEHELATFLENVTQSERHLNYTCTAELEIYGLLSWYQIKESRRTLLNMIQNKDKASNVTLTLYKTVEDSDRDTVFYCVAEPRKKIMRWMTILFGEIDLAPIEPAVVNIESKSTLVYFDTEETMQFVCRGTKPIDGRKLTWYLEKNAESIETDRDSTAIVQHFEIPEHQEYDPNEAENVLKLILNSGYNLKRLFCAEDFSKTIQYEDGTNKIIRFGQRAKSETLTLIQRDGASTKSAFSKPIFSTILAALTLLLILVLSISLIIIIVIHKRKVAAFETQERMWNRKPLVTPNNNTYDYVYSHGAGLKRKPFHAK